MKLTIRDVSQLFAVPEQAVMEWIEGRGLPARRLGDLYHVNRAELLEWAAFQKIPIPRDFFRSDESPGAERLLEALSRGGIHHDISAATREEALREVIRRLPLPDRVSRETMVEILAAREGLVGTGIGDGIAIPHARNPIVFPVDAPWVTLAFLNQPVDFHASDGKPVHILFLLITPTARGHLRMLSRIAFALRDPFFHEAVLRHAGSAELLDALRRLEKEV